MPLADFNDANSHLDGTKIAFVDNNDAEGEANNADRYVVGKLQIVFPDHCDLWDFDPTDPQILTPGIVALAASLLMAAERYRKRYSLEDTGENTFPATLEARADAILNGLIDGTITLPGEDSIYHLNEMDFWPNNKTTVKDNSLLQFGLKPGDPLRFARMDKAF